MHRDMGPGNFDTHEELQAYLDAAEKPQEKNVKAASTLTTASTGPYITANVTRDSFTASKNYSRVLFELGVPLVDSDLNEAGAIEYNRWMQYLGAFASSGAMNASGSTTGFQCTGAGLSLNFNIGAGLYMCSQASTGFGFMLQSTASTYAAQAAITIGGVAVTAPATLTTPTSARTDTIWLEEYYQDYGPLDDNNLYLANSLISSNTDVSHRIKHIGVVRVWEGSGAMSASLAISSAPFYNSARRYYPLAQLARIANQAVINVGDITDLRPILNTDGTVNGSSSIASGTATKFVPLPAISATSSISITPDLSLGGAAPTAALYVSSRSNLNVSGGFTVATIGAVNAPTNGVYFSYRVVV